jgi:hypothetical protein
LNILVSLGSTLSLAKITVIIVDLNIIHSVNKIYFASTGLAVIHNYPSYADSFLASQVTPSYFPTIFGPKFSRNCTFAMYLTFAVNNGLVKKVMFDYTT